MEKKLSIFSEIFTEAFPENEVLKLQSLKEQACKLSNCTNMFAYFV